MMTTLILAPSPQAADALKWAYRGRDDVKVAAITSITGHRGDRVVVLPLPATASDQEREQFAAIMREQVETKVAPGGELIVL